MRHQLKTNVYGIWESNVELNNMYMSHVLRMSSQFVSMWHICYVMNVELIPVYVAHRLRDECRGNSCLCGT